MEIPESAITEIGAGPERVLTEKERGALEFVRARPGQFPLVGTHLQQKLFALFIQGISCLEIARLNHPLHLGQVLTARLEFGWDERRQEHVESLLQATQMRVQQSMVEGIDFITASLASVYKIEGDKIKRYLMSGGDEKELGEFQIKNWSQLHAALNVFKTLTGQDKPAPQKHTGEIVHKHEHTIPAANRSMTTIEATSVIKSALANRKKV